MTWEIIVSLIVAVTGLISAVWAIIKYYDVKRSKKEDDWQKFMQEIRDANTRQDEYMAAMREEVNELKGKLSQLQTDAAAMSERVAHEEDTFKDFQLSTLQFVIMNFATLLRNGNELDMNDFNYIYTAYEKYSALGGNGFISSEMKYIAAKKKELDKKLEQGRP